MSKKTLIAAIIIITIFVSLAAGMHVANVVKANPKPSTIISSSQQPTVKILQPQNDSFFSGLLGGVSFQLLYETDSVLSWVGYSIDGKGLGSDSSGNVTVAKNSTEVSFLYNGGYHTLTLYANDTLGNWANPQTVTYFVNFILDLAPTPSPSPSPSPTEQETLEPSPTLDNNQNGDFTPVIILPAIILSVTIVVAAVLGVLVYFKKYHGKKQS